MAWVNIVQQRVFQIDTVDPTKRFHPALVWVNIAGISPAPQVGWVATQSGNAWAFAPYVPPAPDLAQQAQAALAAGCQIVSTATPALNGTYACDPDTVSNIQTEMISLLANQTFGDGTTTISWDALGGTSHAFSIAQFQEFATALAKWASTLKKTISKNTGTLPAQPVTIA